MDWHASGGINSCNRIGTESKVIGLQTTGTSSMAPEAKSSTPSVCDGLYIPIVEIRVHAQKITGNHVDRKEQSQEYTYIMSSPLIKGLRRNEGVAPFWSAARVAKDANMTFEKLALTHVPPGLVGRDSLPKLFKEYKFNIDFPVYRNKEKLTAETVLTIAHYSE